jgi:hypoxanthine phosphoribosyltransferase
MSDLPKHWISAEQLLLDSMRLAAMVLADGYRPSVVVGLWRGGAAVAVALHEALAFRGLASAHLPLVTRLYNGIDTRAGQLQIEGLGLLQEHLAEPARILLVDDVFDTGTTLSGVVAAIAALPGAGREIRTATPWYKPGRNRSALTPDYWIHASDDWLVFPHELEGLSEQELRMHRGEAFMRALDGEAEA